MHRRTFLKQAPLAAAAGAVAGRAGTTRAPKRRILVWAHLDTDFAGSDGIVRRQLDQAREAGVDTLMPFVHSYPEEWNAWYDASLSGFVVKDRLTRALDLAKQAGIETHPILGGMTDVGLTKGARARRGYLSGKPGGSAQDGRFCGSSAATRTGPLRIATDILDHHPVGGLHLDYIRYIDTGNGLKWPCRCEACRQNYRALFGRDELTAEDLRSPGAVYKYLQFRNANIAGEVAGLREMVRQRGVELSMAARADYFGAALVEGQDWADWARRGWLDFLCPMNYTMDREEHGRLLRMQLAVVGGECPVYSGIGRKWSGGELSTAGMIRQAADAFELGAAGIALFRYNALTGADFREIKGLGAK